jgi:hypothetical protein
MTFPGIHSGTSPGLLAQRGQLRHLARVLRVARSATGAVVRAEMRRAYLRPVDGGWMLATPTGDTVCEALGRDARCECLRCAQRAGALYVR